MQIWMIGFFFNCVAKSESISMLRKGDYYLYLLCNMGNSYGSCHVFCFFTYFNKSMYTCKWLVHLSVFLSKCCGDLALGARGNGSPTESRWVVNACLHVETAHLMHWSLEIFSKHGECAISEQRHWFAWGRAFRDMLPVVLACRPV